MALIDLDHFKSVNDTHGHQVGDLALVAFAGVSRVLLRATDVAGRWGGEEFLVVLPDVELGEEGMQAMDRLRESVARQPICAGAPGLRITFSAGVAVHRRDEPLASTLERADKALYAAKAGGRNRCVLAERRPAPAGTEGARRTS